MMEVMSISHYEYIDTNNRPNNPDRASVAKCIKDMYCDYPEIASSFFNEFTIVKAIYENNPNRIHSYDQYLDCFERVVGHHIEMIKKYRKNHPGYKLIFLILDESTPYEIIDGLNEQTGEKYYEAQIDESFQSILREADIDMVIWFSPYMETPEKKLTNLITFFDPHYPIKTYNYSSSQLRCLESEKGKPISPSLIWWSEDKNGFHRNIIWEQKDV